MWLNKPAPHLFVITPSSLTNNDIELENIAEDIVYVPLDDSQPLKLIYSIKLTKRSIFVSSNAGLSAYHRQGNLKNNIGTIGNGPGEYLHCLKFAIHEPSESVYILDDKKKEIVIFKNNGEFIRNISLNKYKGFVASIEFLDDRLVIAEYLCGGRAD